MISQQSNNEQTGTDPMLVANDKPKAGARTSRLKVVAVFALATCALLTSMAIAASAAWDRGGSQLDRAMMVAISVIAIAAVHLLPAFSRHPLRWAIWVGCFLYATYGHATFFTYASQRAGENRVEMSSQVASITQQIQTVRDDLATIRARPVTTVAVLLKRAHDDQTRNALEIELGEAKRAAELHDQLVRLTGSMTTERVIGATDPVTTRLAAVTGSSASNISLYVSLASSLLLELLGAFLWYEVAAHLGGDNAPVTIAHPHDDDLVAKVQAAIETGECKPTVASIRAFLGCSQSKAMTLRRALIPS